MSPFYFEARRYPEEPGCYLMLSRSGKLLYVGKAVNLRKRLGSYFHSKPDSEKTARLIQEIADIEIMIVRNENESLTLETNLIQYYLPPYNRAKKRERSVAPYIAVTNERMPRLIAVDRDRQAPRAQTGSGETRLIGPFLNPIFRNYALEFAIDRFRLRTCEPLERRLCMRYYLEKCGGICEGMESEEQYGDHLNEALLMLSDPPRVPVEMLRKVERLSEKLQFEKAKELYTRLKALLAMLETQTVNVQRDHHQLVICFGHGHLLAARFEYGLLRTRFLWLRIAEPTASPAAQWAEKLDGLLPGDGPIEIVTNDAAYAEALVRRARLKRLAVRSVVPVKGSKRHMLNICQRNLEYRIADMRREIKNSTQFDNDSKIL